MPGVVVCERDGFDAAVERSLAHPPDAAQMAAFVAGSTWQRRVDALLEEVAGVARAQDVLRALAG